MKEQEFESTVQVPAGLEALWGWHAGPGAFERLVPPWQDIRLLDGPPEMTAGEQVRFRIHWGPFSRTWEAELKVVEPPGLFIDDQISGPFGSWRHEHRMRAYGAGQSQLTDHVRYRLPAGMDAIPWARRQGRRELARLFGFRHRRMREDLEAIGEGAGAGNGVPRTVLISGARGLIGRRLVPCLKTLGYTVRGLTRGVSRGNLFHWDPGAGLIDPKALEGVDAVIHLAGENIAGGRWTRERRRRILESRRQGTRTLVAGMRKVRPKPTVLVSASGVNFYGHCARECTEATPSGDGFLAEVCRAWEAEATEARADGIRTCIVRTGIVLDPSGGALGKMLIPFRLGLGGPIGGGQQAFPWIAMDDLLDVYERALRDPRLDGPVNAVHPETVSQRVFSSALGAVLRRPALAPLPAGVVKTLFGEMGQETLLADLDIRPGVLESVGHRFRSRDLDDALRFLLGRPINS